MPLQPLTFKPGINRDKRCCKCATVKDAGCFYANKRVKDGLNSFCIDCHKADNIARKKTKRADPEFRKKERELKAAYRAKTVAERSRYMREWHAKNIEGQTQYRKRYAVDNAEYFVSYRKRNKTKILAKTRKRQVAQLQRTPAWLATDDFWLMEQAYELAALRTQMLGYAWHVDHILPLQGKRVSGLHVPQNLSVIPAVQNYKKHNRFEVA